MGAHGLPQHALDGVDPLFFWPPRANVTAQRIESIRLHQRDPEACIIQQLHAIVSCSLQQKHVVADAVFASHIQASSSPVSFAGLSAIADHRQGGVSTKRIPHSGLMELCPKVRWCCDQCAPLLAILVRDHEFRLELVPRSP